MVSEDQAMLALAGKAVERGLVPTWPPEDGLLRIHVPHGEMENRTLHSQAFRGLAKRLNSEASVHISSTHNGLVLEYDAPNGEVEQDAADRIIDVLQTMIAEFRAAEELEEIDA